MYAKVVQCRSVPSAIETIAGFNTLTLHDTRHGGSSLCRRLHGRLLCVVCAAARRMLVLVVGVVHGFNTSLSFGVLGGASCMAPASIWTIRNGAAMSASDDMKTTARCCAVKRDTEKEEPICSTPVDSLKALYRTEFFFGISFYVADTPSVARATYVRIY